MSTSTSGDSTEQKGPDFGGLAVEVVEERREERGGGRSSSSKASDPKRLVEAFAADEEYLGKLAYTEYVPHGLYNYGNTCFLNSVLHMLFSCQDVRGFLNDLKECRFFDDDAPVLEAFIACTKSVVSEQVGSSIYSGASFYPKAFESIVERFCTMTSGPGYTSRSLPQQDAQEFLLHLIDQMHEEMIVLRKKALADVEEEEGKNTHQNGIGNGTSNTAAADADVWEEVGKNNKSAFTRRHTEVQNESRQSRMTSIFGGLLRSTVRATGATPSVCIEPFTVLQLDISADEVDSVGEAMKRFSSPEYLDDYAASGVASKTVQIEVPPLVLVIQLLRFSYTNTGHSVKVTKACKIPEYLTIKKDATLVSGLPSLQYELFATISHHGNSMQSGHYTSDFKDQNGNWFHCDDENIEVSTASYAKNSDVYIVMYRQVG
jgi:ubiquitin carboxyl-terminal hydrolase 10